MGDTTLTSIRDSYDRIAAAYAEHLAAELDHKPFDRNLLDRFATAVMPGGQVCDLGCGPGHIARYLRSAGLNIFGLDLSPRMIEQARLLNPDIPFRVGNMLGLDLADGILSGIVAFYSIVNLPSESLRQVFEEVFRVLQAGGIFLLSFHVGEASIRPEELWGYSVCMDFHLFPVRTVQHDLEMAGFVIEGTHERDPYPPEVEYQSRRAYIFGRKP